MREPNLTNGVDEWREKIAETSALVSAILAVIHPDLYAAGHQTLRNLRRNPNLKPAINAWPSVFNAISIISNRNCLPHRDANTRSEWYDALVTISPPNSTDSPILSLISLGIEAKYTSGSFVAMSGRLIEHTVSDCQDQRMAYSFTMKDSVHHAAGVKTTGWMEPSILGTFTTTEGDDEDAYN